MAKYYQFLPFNRTIKSMLALEIKLVNFYWWDLDKAKPINEWDSLSSFSSKKNDHDGPPDDYLATLYQIPVFSPCLQQAMQDAKIGINDVQFLPVKVFKSTGEEIKGYAIANVITSIPCLHREGCFMIDESEDEIDVSTGLPRIKTIGKCSIYGEKLIGHDFIRIAECKSELILSERFYKLFKKRKFTGMGFKEVKSV